MASTINLSSLGKDSEKGGVFLNSNLLPGGVFSNIPNKTNYNKPSSTQEATLTLTLEKIKDSLKAQLQQTDGANVADAYLEKFLYEFTSLLVDYRDMRNYIFYGSANTEIAYNIKNIIETFPFKYWVGIDTTDLDTANANLQIINNTSTNTTSLIFSEKAIIDGIEQFNFFDNSTDFNWSNYEVVDVNQNRYGIIKTISPYIDYSITQLNISSIVNGTNPSQEDLSGLPTNLPVNVPSFTTLEITTATNNTYQVGDLISLLDVQITNGAITKDISGEYAVSYISSPTTFCVVSKFKASDILNGKKPRPVDSVLIPTGYSVSLTSNSKIRKYATVLNIVNISTDTNPQTTDNTVNPAATIPSFTTMKITTNLYHGYKVGDVVSVICNEIKDEFVVSYIISNTSFLVVNKYTANSIANGGKPKPYDAIDVNFTFSTNVDALVRKFPASYNSSPFITKLIINGNLFENYLETSSIISSTPKSGFLISPTKTILAEFEYNLSDIQRILLSPSPINPTPWPRRPITNNIQNLLVSSNWNPAENNFLTWIQDPNFLYLSDGVSDADIAFSDTYTEYRLVRALSLDETTTNNLIRRCIPHNIISEINDPNLDFQRFILIAGWFFDQIKLYVDFLKYTHHINTSDFNQLSPEYYRYYASHYGLDLFTDDGIDFSKLVIQTEPGLYFRQQALQETDSKFYQLTLQQLQYERQKRLLLSLFYLYKTKGTQGTIKKLVSLLGAPDGFFLLSEFSFAITNIDNNDYYDKNNMVGQRIVDNTKVNVPSFSFEQDPNFPVPLGMPPVYKMRLNNESVFNLRQVGMQTNPNGAIDSQIINVFGSQMYNYGKFSDGEYANLQNSLSPYYFLPLTIPDKFIGISVEYMIPQDGFKKGVADNQEESNIHLCSLYEIPKAFDGTTISTEFTYPMAVNSSNKNNYSIAQFTDAQLQEENTFNLLQDYTHAPFDMSRDYIICRIEGNDLVIRLRINSETQVVNPDNNLDVGERVAIMENIFKADGLNHTLRLLMRPEGVEVYLDYMNVSETNGTSVGVALWRNPLESNISNEPFVAFEIPKSLISTCNPLTINPAYYEASPTNTGNDLVRNWDMFIGLPINLDLYFKRVSVFEGYSANSFDIADNIINNKNYTSEYWDFSFVDNQGDNNDLKIRCEFSIKEPNLVPAYYNYKLPIESFNNKEVVQNLSLTSKTLFPEITTKYFIKQQSFFEATQLFEQNAWQSDLHKAYNYQSFSGEVLKLYNLYSPQVLTYDSLASFLDLIENKFRPLIENFIPIVVNISEFGRLINNSSFIYPKVFYRNVHKNCIGEYVGKNAILQFRLYDLIPTETNFSFEIENSDRTSFIPPIPITWDQSTRKTEYDLLFAIRSLNLPNFSIYLNDGMFSLSVNASWYYNTYFTNALDDNGNATTHTNLNSNDLLVKIIYGTTELDLNFAYASLSVSDNSCGSIEYKIPNRNVTGEWVYFDSEKQPGRIIYNASENQPVETYLNFK